MVSYITPGREIDLLALLFAIGAVGFMVWRSVKGKPLPLRKVAALDAVDELVGRAAEMGQPVLMTPGAGSSFVQTEQAPQFISFLSLLSYVARKAYDSGTKVIAATTIPEMVPLCQQTLLDNARSFGNPDAYSATQVRYFPNATAFTVAMMALYESKEAPASFIMVGPVSEELIFLATLAATHKALNIGGTISLLNIPIVAAMFDYVLMGEEVFAASAYLDKEPVQVGAINGQDVIKFVAITVAIVGFLLSQFR